MKIIRTRGGKFKGLSLTRAEYNRTKEIYSGSCLAVAEREIAREFEIDITMASKALSAVVFDYKYLTVED